MKNHIKNTILVLLVLVGIGTLGGMIEGPNKNWVCNQIGEHNGTIEDVSETGIMFRMDDKYVRMTWQGAESYFKDLND